MLRIDASDLGSGPGSGGKASLHWLRILASLLDKATCKQGGRAVAIEAGLEALLQLWAEQAATGRSIYWIGNGGSAAMVSHLSQDVLNKCGIRSFAFNDPALLTCMANDFGYEQVFKRPLEATARAGDLLMAVSSSGESENVVSAAAAGRDLGLRLATFSAFSPDNRLRAAPADLSFHVPTMNYGHAELAHEALIHSVVDSFERLGAGAVPAPSSRTEQS